MSAAKLRPFTGVFLHGAATPRAVVELAGAAPAAEGRTSAGGLSRASRRKPQLRCFQSAGPRRSPQRPAEGPGPQGRPSKSIPGAGKGKRKEAKEAGPSGCLLGLLGEASRFWLFGLARLVRVPIKSLGSHALFGSLRSRSWQAASRPRCPEPSRSAARRPPAMFCLKVACFHFNFRFEDPLAKTAQWAAKSAAASWTRGCVRSQCRAISHMPPSPRHLRCCWRLSPCSCIWRQAPRALGGKRFGVPSSSRFARSLDERCGEDSERCAGGHGHGGLFEKVIKVIAGCRAAGLQAAIACQSHEEAKLPERRDSSTLAGCRSGGDEACEFRMRRAAWVEESAK